MGMAMLPGGRGWAPSGNRLGERPVEPASSCRTLARGWTLYTDGFPIYLVGIMIVPSDRRHVPMPHWAYHKCSINVTACLLLPPQWNTLINKVKSLK